MNKTNNNKTELRTKRKKLNLDKNTNIFTLNNKNKHNDDSFTVSETNNISLEDSAIEFRNIQPFEMGNDNLPIFPNEISSIAGYNNNNRKTSIAESTVLSEINFLSHNQTPVKESSPIFIENINNNKQDLIMKQKVNNEETPETPKLSRKKYDLFKRRKSSVAALNSKSDSPEKHIDSEKLAKMFKKPDNNNNNNDHIDPVLTDGNKLKCVCLAENIVLGVFLTVLTLLWLATLAVSIYFYAIGNFC
jgi:hypothetical protein